MRDIENASLLSEERLAQAESLEVATQARAEAVDHNAKMAVAASKAELARMHARVLSLEARLACAEQAKAATEIDAAAAKADAASLHEACQRDAARLSLRCEQLAAELLKARLEGQDAVNKLQRQLEEARAQLLQAETYASHEAQKRGEAELHHRKAEAARQWVGVTCERTEARLSQADATHREAEEARALAEVGLRQAPEWPRVRSTTHGDAVSAKNGVMAIRCAGSRKVEGQQVRTRQDEADVVGVRSSGRLRKPRERVQMCGQTSGDRGETFDFLLQSMPGSPAQDLVTYNSALKSRRQRFLSQVIETLALMRLHYALWRWGHNIAVLWLLENVEDVAEEKQNIASEHAFRLASELCDAQDRLIVVRRLALGHILKLVQVLASARALATWRAIVASNKIPLSIQLMDSTTERRSPAAFVE